MTSPYLDRPILSYAERLKLAKLAYEVDCLAKPNYPNGKPRIKWDQLGEIEQSSWIKNPSPRWLPC